MLNRLGDLRERFLQKPDGWPAAVALLLVRVSVGIVFAQTGWGKLHHLDDIIEYFRTLEIPAPELQAPFVASLEFVGGSLLILGLGARFLAAPLIGTMVVAILTAKKAEIESLTDVLGFIEWHYLVFFAVIVLLGAGKLSPDFLIAKRLFDKPTDPKK
jgi:putative oxidoreductase